MVIKLYRNRIKIKIKLIEIRRKHIEYWIAIR